MGWGIGEELDPKMEAEAREWIEACLEEKLSSDVFQEALCDGVVLCNLINKIKPGCCTAVQEDAEVCAA